MKKYLFSICKIVLSVVTIPLWFVKMFSTVGYLPNQDGSKFLKVVFRHSMYENIGDLTDSIIIYFAMATAVFSAIMNVFTLKFHNKKAINIISNVSFIVALVLFLILCLLASTVFRGI